MAAGRPLRSRRAAPPPALRRRHRRLQVGWVALLSLPDGWRLVGFLVLVAGRAGRADVGRAARHDAWHPRHIAERYGLFTIIVLGESVLAATLGGADRARRRRPFAELATVAVGGLLIVFAHVVDLLRPAGRARRRPGPRGVRRRRSGGAFIWGYGHSVVFASAAAVGAGLQVGFDRVTGHADLSSAEGGATVGVPVIVYVLSLWALHVQQKQPGPMRSVAAPTAVVAVVIAIWLPSPVLVIGLVLTVLVTAGVIAGGRWRTGVSETEVGKR